MLVTVRIDKNLYVILGSWASRKGYSIQDSRLDSRLANKGMFSQLEAHEGA